MENASKALIIAGGMLLAMLIVGLITWGYGNIRNYRQTQVEIQKMNDTVEANKKFEAYNRGNVRGYQMISLANLANDINKRYEDEGYKKVNIIATMSDENQLPKAEKADRVKDAKYRNYYDIISYVENIYETLNPNEKNQFKQYYFECENVEYDEQNGRVTRMIFRQLKVNAST